MLSHNNFLTKTKKCNQNFPGLLKCPGASQGPLKKLQIQQKGINGRRRSRGLLPSGCRTLTSRRASDRE
jgi:hypothetical protein